jgi:hypothetical protein
VDPATRRGTSDRRVFGELAAATSAARAGGAQTTIDDIPCSSGVEDAGRARQPNSLVEAQPTGAERNAWVMVLISGVSKPAGAAAREGCLV